MLVRWAFMAANWSIVVSQQQSYLGLGDAPGSASLPGTLHHSASSQAAPDYPTSEQFQFQRQAQGAYVPPLSLQTYSATQQLQQHPADQLPQSSLHVFGDGLSRQRGRASQWSLPQILLQQQMQQSSVAPLVGDVTPSAFGSSAARPNSFLAPAAATSLLAQAATDPFAAGVPVAAPPSQGRGSGGGMGDDALRGLRTAFTAAQRAVDALPDARRNLTVALIRAKMARDPIASSATITQPLPSAFAGTAAGQQIVDYPKAPPRGKAVDAQGEGFRPMEAQDAAHMKKTLDNIVAELQEEQGRNEVMMADLQLRMAHMMLVMVAVFGFGVSMVSVYWCSKVANPIAVLALIFFLMFVHLYG